MVVPNHVHDSCSISVNDTIKRPLTKMDANKISFQYFRVQVVDNTNPTLKSEFSSLKSTFGLS